MVRRHLKRVYPDYVDVIVAISYSKMDADELVASDLVFINREVEVKLEWITSKDQNKWTNAGQSVQR